ncbi:MAG: hypothetical protein LAO56_12605 [Acidobacteriia bacterium]|nr:hypothetical protein [Terriglobia bacterium]
MNPLAWKQCAPRLAMTLVAIAVLLTAVGCGDSVHIVPINGNFSDASLKGQYAFTLRGIGTPDNINSFYFVEAGVFTADGNGNLTAVTDDFVQDFQSFSDNITGVYRINKDGTGDVQFNFSNGLFTQFRITLSDDSHFYMEEDDGFATSGGSGEMQNAASFASVPSGTFVSQTHDLVQGSSKVGILTFNAGQITGTEDVLIGGALSTGVNITGSATAPNTTSGRGTMTITDSTGTSTYDYYVVSAGKLRFLNTTATASLAIGQAEAQTGSGFSAASLNGTYVFGSSGESTNVDGVHSVGMFAADGAGNITTGTFDTVQDGNPVTNISLNSGSAYSVDSAGRAVVTLNLSSGITNEKVMWLVSSSRAYFLVNDPVNVEDGTLDKQTGSGFSDSSMNGQYAFVMDGFDANQQLPYRDRVGTWIPNGSGSVTTNYVASGFLPSSPPLGSSTLNNGFSGTYAIDASGRATANVNGLSSGLILYLVSNNSGYMLQADTGVDIGGAFTVQTGP